MKYRTKQCEIEAVQFDGTNYDEIEEFTDLAAFAKEGYMEVGTLKGIMTASVGDFIIKGLKGEFYPCKPEIFELKYEPAE